MAESKGRLRAREAVTNADSGADKLDDLADAASDVWEPLLQDLLVAYEHAVEGGGQGHHLDDSVLAWGGYTRAKEALSE